MKKFISILLCSVIFLSFMSPAALAYAEDQNKYPMVLVWGMTNDDVYDKDGNTIYPINADTDSILQEAKACLPALGRGIVSGDYTEWEDQFVEAMLKYYGPLLPDKNGEISNGSYIKFSYDKNNVRKNGRGIYDYRFSYDWRLSPIYTADLLHEYVEAIINSTGCKKVRLVGRCYASSVLAAYLTKYGCDEIDTTVFYSPTSNGVGSADAFFTGKLDLDPQTIANFLDSQGDLFNNETLTELLISTLSFFKDYGIQVPLDAFVSFVNKVYPSLGPKVLLSMYAAMPAYWTLVSSDKYEEAKTFIFKGREEEYKGLIEKIDAYHYGVQVNTEETIKNCVDKGMKFAIISKYNFPLAPFFKGAEYTSDDTVETWKTSYGATTAKYGSVLTSSQVKAADPKHLSSDHIIDASTCLFPDYTWFIKDLAHTAVPACADRLIAEICNFDGQMTVFDNESYPQFLQFTDNNIVPLNAEPIEKTEKERFFERLARFIRALIASLKQIFEKISSDNK